MRKLIVIFKTVFLVSQVAVSQTLPMSQKLDGLKDIIELDDFKIEFSKQEIQEVIKSDETKQSPMRYGIARETILNIDDIGDWEDAEGIGRIWRFRISAPNAKGLSLIFDKFDIPQGAEFYIYDSKSSEIFFTFTHRDMTKSGRLGVGPIGGEDIILEYFVPYNISNRGKIEISKVTYGINYIANSNLKALDDPDNHCHVDINCAEGEFWQNEAKGIVRILVDQTWWCSGSLIISPISGEHYVLTANHCFGDIPGFDSENLNSVDTWTFTFNLEKESCNSSNTSTSFTRNGGTLVANDAPSDFALIRLDRIRSTDDVYFNGWSRTTTPTSGGVGIHHPIGDYKKISTHDIVPVLGRNDGTGAMDSHWEIDPWSQTTNGHGVTSGGSSGSPLLTSDKLIIGQLHGGGFGNPNCDDPANDDSFYGSFAFSWEANTSNHHRNLKSWLDPLNLNLSSLSGKSNLTSNCNFSPVIVNNTVELYGGRSSSPFANILVNFKIVGGEYFYFDNTNNLSISNVRINGQLIFNNLNLQELNTNSYQFTLDLSGFNFSSLENTTVDLKFDISAPSGDVQNVESDIYFLTPSLTSLLVSPGLPELDYIQKVVDRGIFKGKGSAGFAPGDALTMAEAAKIVCQVGLSTDDDFELIFDASQGFANGVDLCHWAFPYVQTLINKGAITDLAGFDPNRNIRYDELAYFVHMGIDQVTITADALNEHITYNTSIRNSLGSQYETAIEAIGNSIALIDVLASNKTIRIAEALQTNAFFDNISFNNNQYNIDASADVLRADAAVLMANLYDYILLIDQLNGQNAVKKDVHTKSNNANAHAWQHNLVGAKLNLDSENEEQPILNLPAETFDDDSPIEFAVAENDQNGNPLAFFWNIEGGDVALKTPNKYNAVRWTPPTVSSPTVFELYVWVGNTKGGYAHGVKEITITPSGNGGDTAPSVQTSNMRITNVMTNEFRGRWDRGNGEKVIVTCTPCSSAAGTPVDGSDYSANSNFNNAPSLGNSKVVYEGTGSSVTIIGLSTNTCYRLRAYEFNGVGTETKYLLTNPATDSESTSDLLTLDFDWDPDPIVAGVPVDFDWISPIGLSTEDWVFQGGSPSTNNTNGCCVTWNNPGIYRVTLTGWHAPTDQTITIFKDIEVISLDNFRPDLELTINELTPDVVIEGQTIEVSWTTTNIGLDNAKLTNSQYFLSQDLFIDNGDTELIQSSDFNFHGKILLAQQSFSHTKVLDIPNDLSPGNWYLLVRVNSEQALSADYPEENFANNTAGLPFEIVEDLPDLTLQNVSISKSVVRSGEDFDVTATMASIGSYCNLCGCVEYSIYISEDQILDENDDEYIVNNGEWCKSVKSGTFTHTRTVFVDPDIPDGNYFLLIGYDISLEDRDHNQVRESNEDNNSVVLPITISSPFQPSIQAKDLAISNVGETSLDLSWTKGNGQFTIVVATIGNKLDPLDDWYYFANNDWNEAPHFYHWREDFTEDETRIVYNGEGENVTVYNLPSDKSVYFTAYSFNSTQFTDHLQKDAETVVAHLNPTSQSFENLLDGNRVRHLDIRQINDADQLNSGEVQFFVGHSGRALISSGGGEYYEVFQLNKEFRSIAACNVLSENKFIAFDENGEIFESFDQGNTWTQRNIDPSTTISLVYDSYFINDQIGFVLARREADGAGIIYKTSDGGTSWETKRVSPDRGYTVHEKDGIVWISGLFGTLIKSTDVGESWQVVNSNLNPEYSIGAVHFVTTQIGFCSSGGTLNKTVDGGLTWTDVLGFSSSSFNQTIEFVSTEVGYFFSNSAPQLLYMTTDGGDNWSEVSNSARNGDYYFYEPLVLTESEVIIFGNGIRKLNTCMPTEFYADNDNDGFGDVNDVQMACFSLVGYVQNDLDCDDNNANIFPNAVEICDNQDNNCDGLVDEGVQQVFYIDNDNDGFGSLDGQTVMGCSTPQGYENNNEDCDDNNALVYPGANEMCDGLDNNCNDDIDEGNNCSPNDDICSAIEIEVNSSYNGNTALATLYNPDQNLIACDGASDFQSANEFYKLIGAQDWVTLSLCNSVFNTRLNIFEFNGSCLTTNFNCVVGNNDYCNLQSEVSFLAEENIWYLIVVSGDDLSEGNYQLDVSFSCDRDLLVQQPIVGDYTFRANSIQSDATFNASHRNIFNAGSSTEFLNGFSVENGVFTVIMDDCQ